jgi:hypothetical protein
MRYEESSLFTSLVQLILPPKVYRMTGLITDYSRYWLKKGCAMSEATLPLQAAAPPRFSEDLVAVGLGLVVFLLALAALAGADALG